MRVRRLRIEGFGNLRGEFIFSSDRCNLILEPNESGKSTLTAAIQAALYGFPRQRASREHPITERECHRPWKGETYAVELELECRDRAYVVRRDFDQETVSIHDGLSGKEITSEFASGKDQIDLGLALTGLSREDFTRCCFVGQRDIESLRDAGGLTHALQRIASSQGGDVAAGEALEILERATGQEYKGKLLGKGKVETEIRRLEKEIDEVRGVMEKIAARRRDSEGRIMMLEETTRREGRAEADLVRVDYLQLLSAREEARSSLDQCNRDAAQIDEYRAELSRLADYASFPAERLGTLREKKGRIDTLAEKQEEARQALETEVEEPLGVLTARLGELSSLEALSSDEIASVRQQLTVIQERWEMRRRKRAELRREQRALREAGVEPRRLTDIAASLAGLDEEDRTFLSGYRERHLELKAGLGDAERERDRLTRHEEGETPMLMPLSRGRRGEGLALAAGFLGVVLSILVYFTTQNRWPLIATGALALGGFVTWFLLLERRPLPGAEEFGSELQQIQTGIWAREKELAAMRERLAGLSSRSGRSRPEDLVEDYREMERIQEKAAPLATLAAACAEIQQLYAEAASGMEEMMRRAGFASSRRPLTPRLAGRFAERIAEFAAARERANTLEAERDTRLADIDAMAGETLELRSAMTRLLAGDGDPSAGDPLEIADLEEALTRFEEAARKRERHDQLSREILPAALGRHPVPPAERSAMLERDIEVLSRQIERALAARPALGGLGPEMSSREYADERRRLQEEVRSTQTERMALSEELGDVLKDYRRDYPGYQTMLDELEDALRRARDFQTAVALAAEVLTSISREAYAEWAEVLNEKTSGIIRRLNPRYEDIRFDTDLSFTVRDSVSGRRLDQSAVDAQLSSGARDQIYLAARLAISEYLSAAGVRLPFILDDPFATFDDSRFARAMEFLLETLSKRHQIIILSCHEDRHRKWRSDPGDPLAERVRVLDLTPLST